MAFWPRVKALRFVCDTIKAWTLTLIVSFASELLRAPLSFRSCHAWIFLFHQAENRKPPLMIPNAHFWPCRVLCPYICASHPEVKLMKILPDEFRTRATWAESANPTGLRQTCRCFRTIYIRVAVWCVCMSFEALQKGETWSSKRPIPLNRHRDTPNLKPEISNP